MPSPHTTTMAARNARLARTLWPALSRTAIQGLRTLCREIPLSLAAGDITYLEKGWYITHAGLLRLARRNHCAGIQVRPALEFCDPAANRWAFKAIVYKSPRCKGFVGYGDADPSNVSDLVRGAEMRVAETRAVNRALRKAYGIGICSVEELGSFSGPLSPAAGQKKPVAKADAENGNGHHPLRDRLCLLIRRHQLDPGLVKAYAADYCGVSELRLASREQVVAFVKHLAEYASRNRDGLVCQLNSLAPKAVTAAEASVQVDEQKAKGAA